MSHYSDEIKRLKEEEAREKTLEEWRKGATQLRDLFNEYVTAGFSEEQAYEILTIQLRK